jgi:hypothetical protein
VAVVVSMAQGEMAGQGQAGGVEAAALAGLAGFRRAVYGCCELRADALFELGDAVLCAPGRVGDLAHLSLVPEFGRGHGSLYGGVNAGRVDVAALRRAVAAWLPLPAWPDGGIRLAVDKTCWLRPGAPTSPELLHCLVRGRGKQAGQVVPGWPFSVVAALGPGASSWVTLLDAVRLGPGDDECRVTAAQLREVIVRLIAAGRWREGDPLILVVLDSGYNTSRLTYLLRDLPVELVIRVRGDRVFWRTPPPKLYGESGRPRRHGAPLRCAGPDTWDGPAVRQQAEHPRHGILAVRAWQWVHQRLDRHCGGWEDWPPGQDLPVIEGTVILLEPAGPRAAPMWLWCSQGGASATQVTTAWQAYLRRFDIEHAFRFLKTTLGWDKPMLRNPQAADRWTWLLLACYNQLVLARPLAAALRMPWNRPLPPGLLTPGRVRAGFRHARAQLPVLASPAKPSRPGPGRPKGSRNKQKAPRQRVGKTNPKPRRHKKNNTKHANQTG